LTAAPPPHDLLLSGGHVVDPASGLDGRLDVALRDGRIAAIGAPGTTGAATTRIDCSGKLVLPGLIDTHGHVFRYVTGRFGLDADLCGVQSGVTTMVDQGGPSCMTLPAFRAWVHEPSATRVLAYLSAYLVGGMEGHFYPSLYKPDCVDVDATVRAARENRDLVKGLKAHAELGGFARWGSAVIRLAAQAAREAAIPLYIHFGQLWPLPETGDNGVDPDAILPEVIELLRAGDILAHPFTRHPGGFVDRSGRVHPIVREAIARGLKIDVGHGSHFSFRMARIALDAGIVPDTLGADMHGYNTPMPRLPGTPDAHPDTEHMFFGKVRFSLASAMTSMLALGLPLDHVVAMATVRAVDVFGLPPELGRLRVGGPGDVSVLDDLRGRFVLRDNEGTEVPAARWLQPAFCLRDGRRFDATAAILPQPDAVAA
jgi:dihydroorotase